MWPEKQDIINITPVNPGQERCCDSALGKRKQEVIGKIQQTKGKSV